MIANAQKTGILLIVIILLCAIESYGIEDKVEKGLNTVPDKTATLTSDSTISGQGSEPKKTSGSSLFFSFDELHEVIREERIASLVEIDKQRKETLVYLTQERQAILNELKAELTRITELIDTERATTMVELQEIGLLIAENAILNSKQVIDHLFVRMLQFVAIMIISLIIFILIVYGIIAKKKKHPY